MSLADPNLKNTQGFPVYCLKKNGKTRDVLHALNLCLTSDKKVNIVNFFVCTITVSLYSVAVLGMG